MTRKRATVWLSAILLLTLALYAPSLGNGFALDDRLIAKAVRDSGEPNAMVHELQPLGRYLATNYWQGIENDDVLYRPVTVLSYALVYRALGSWLDGEAGEALAQHAVNVALHLLAVWLVYRLLRRLRAGRGPALGAALAFGLHAIHSEVVAGVVGRAELLSFGAGAGALLIGASLGTRPRAQRIARGAAAAGLLLVACCSKESAVAWAPLWLLVELVRARRATPAAGILAALRPHLLPIVAASALALGAFLWLRARMIAGLPPGAEERWSALLSASFAGLRPANGCVQWAYALLNTLLPWHLSADWGPQVFDPVESLADPRLLGALALLASVALAGLLALRRQELLFLAAAAFLGMSFLTSNVPFRIGTEYAERLYYAPSLSLSLLVAWLLARPRPVLLAGFGLWLAWSGSWILRRNPVWASNEALYAHEAVHQPRSARMQLEHGKILEAKGQAEAAAAHFARVVELFPEHAWAWNWLGVQSLRGGNAAEAVARLRRAVEARHGQAETRVMAAVNLAVALAQADGPEAAKAPLELAARTDAALARARVKDVLAHFSGKLPDGWLADYAATLDAPELVPWLAQRARAAYDARRLVDARELYRRLLASRPSPAQAASARAYLASVLAGLGEMAEAERLAVEAEADPAAAAGVRKAAAELLVKIRAAK